jgi:tetratricopeptide (TPR) repeat protein
VEQLSEDILRYLESRPVMARPDTMVYRLSRFTKRNRWGVAAVAAVAASLAAGAAVSLTQARVAQQRFQDVRKLARRFIELDDDVARLPGSTAVREKMVATALDYLDNLARSAGNDSSLLHELGQAYAKVAYAQGAPGQANLGKIEDSLRNMRKAIEFERRAAALDPSYKVPLATTQSNAAYDEMLVGRLKEARQDLEASAALLDQLRAAKPDDAETLRVAASVATRRADLTEYEGHSKDGLPFLQQAQQLSSEYARVKGDNNARAGHHLISTLLATALADNDRFEDALKVLRDSEPIIDGLLAVEPENPTYIRQKMAMYNYRGSIYDDETDHSMGKPAEAVAAYRQYVALAQHLVDSDPNNASARFSLGIAYFHLSYPLGKLDPPEALRAAQRSVAIFEADLARKPKDRLLRSRRARALRHLAYAWERNHRRADARHAIQEALAVQQQLLSETPSDGAEREQVAISQKLLDSLRQ